MLRHIAVFRWAASAPATIADELARRLDALPAAIPELQTYRFGPDAGLVAGNYDFAVVADFDDVEAWRAYAEHPEHQAVLRDLVTPNIEHRAAVQFTF